MAQQNSPEQSGPGPKKGKDQSETEYKAQGMQEYRETLSASFVLKNLGADQARQIYRNQG